MYLSNTICKNKISPPARKLTCMVFFSADIEVAASTCDAREFAREAES